MLLLAVSMGVGVVKLRLGTTLCKIVGVGFVHFVCFSLSEIMTMSVPQVMRKKIFKLMKLTIVPYSEVICPFSSTDSRDWHLVLGFPFSA